MKKAILLLGLISCIQNQPVQVPSDIVIPPMNERKVTLDKIEEGFDSINWKVSALTPHIISSNTSNRHLIFTIDPDPEVADLVLSARLSSEVRVEFETLGKGIKIISYYQDKEELASGTFCDADSVFEYHYRGFSFLVACFKSLSVLK